MEAQEGKPRKATFLQAAKAVLSAFFGVRKSQEHESMTVTPLQLIVAGIVGAALFVLGLIMLVHFITS